MKLKDFATKLQRLEFQDVADGADKTRAVTERVARLERDAVDNKSLDTKLAAITDKLKTCIYYPIHSFIHLSPCTINDDPLLSISIYQ
jgi:hypothetical protein